MTPTSTGFHNASLSVGDLAHSAEWYERVLGLSLLFEEKGEERRARMYRIDGATVTLGLVEHRGGGDDGFRPDRTGLDHLAFDVESREEAHRWSEHLDGVQLAISWEKPT